MKEQYRNEYLASLHGHTWSEIANRTFPRLSKPHTYAQFDQEHRNGVVREITSDDQDRIRICSDHHFNHKNIIKYSDRPFTSVTDMNDVMLICHNLSIHNDDIVFMLGDINMGSADEANHFLDQMNGYKILIIGNHDWAKNGKIKRYNVDEMYVSYYLPWARIMMTHAPFDSHIPYSKGFLNVHGHIHEHLIDSDQYKNVCVEHTNYAPIRLGQLLDFNPIQDR